jgi:hypothetical protein
MGQVLYVLFEDWLFNLFSHVGYYLSWNMIGKEEVDSLRHFIILLASEEVKHKARG